MPFNSLLLAVIILLEGFITISFEILTFRQLLPVAGNSVVVTSLIIGIFLLFLAYGYRKGGSYENNYQAILARNFCWAAIGLSIGLSYSFVEIFFYGIQKFVGFNLLIPLVLYLLVIVAPVVYLLGQTVPITFNLYSKEHRAGWLSGKILHLSTIGSFLGAVVTSLLLLNYLGVSWTICIDFIILAGLVILISDVSKKTQYLILLSVFSIIAYWSNVMLENGLFIATNNYANYQLISNFNNTLTGPGKLLMINDSPSAFINSDQQGFPYAEYIKKTLFSDLKLQHKKILILGGGGFTLTAGLKNNTNDFTYVDIDKNLPSIVKKQFINNINGHFIADDARHFLTLPTTSYDVIIADAYSNRYSLPGHLLTREYFMAVKNKLTDNGLAIFNIIANPELADAYSKRLDNTIRAVFPSCMATPLQYWPKQTNILYICHKGVYESDKMVYTDNLNRSTLDFFGSMSK